MKIKNLVKSPLNRRAQYPDNMIEDLAESILEDGLLSKLVLRPKKEDKGSFEVLAGWRRRLALSKNLGEDADMPEAYYIVKDVDDYSAIKLYLTENVQRVNLSSLELSEGAQALKACDPKITIKQIARILWTTEARVKRLLDLPDHVDALSASAVRELGTPDEMAPAFTDAHMDAMDKAGAFSLPEETIREVCEMIIANDIPASKVKTVVDKMTPKEEATPPTAEDPKTPEEEGRMQDSFKGLVTMDGDVILVESRKETKPLDLEYYRNFVCTPDKFRVFLNAKITIKPVTPEQ